MTSEGITCPGCGSSDVDFDPVTRRTHCNQCGRDGYYSRDQVASLDRVSTAVKNAIGTFTSGNRANARRFAGDVLNILPDSLPALFIMAYIDEFSESVNNAIDKYFKKAEEIKEVKGDEVREMITLFTAALYNMRDYEEQMLTLIVENMQAPEDRPELEAFIEKVSPYCIAKYPSEDFLTEDRCSLYCDIAANCNIPKTCFALLKGIEKNPDSPYVTGTFYMKARTQYFFDNYVKRVGKVIEAMKNSEVKPKFVNAYNGYLQKYQAGPQFYDRNPAGYRRSSCKKDHDFKCI